jgi:hypothetical protein
MDVILRMIDQLDITPDELLDALADSESEDT